MALCYLLGRKPQADALRVLRVSLYLELQHLNALAEYETRLVKSRTQVSQFTLSINRDLHEPTAIYL
jgi:hypothetical protein